MKLIFNKYVIDFTRSLDRIVQDMDGKFNNFNEENLEKLKNVKDSSVDYMNHCKNELQDRQNKDLHEINEETARLNKLLKKNRSEFDDAITSIHRSILGLTKDKSLLGSNIVVPLPKWGCDGCDSKYPNKEPELDENIGFHKLHAELNLKELNDTLAFSRTLNDGSLKLDVNDDDADADADADDINNMGPVIPQDALSPFNRSSGSGGGASKDQPPQPPSPAKLGADGGIMVNSPFNVPIKIGTTSGPISSSKGAGAAAAAAAPLEISDQSEEDNGGLEDAGSVTGGGVPGDPSVHDSPINQELKPLINDDNDDG